MKKTLFFILILAAACDAPAQQRAGSGTAGGGTNFGVFSANTAFVSASRGVVSPVVGDPNKPYLTAQAAADACPSNGTVAVCDGTFHEVVNVTNSQTWNFADNTYLDSFTVQPSAPNFEIKGLGSLGLQGTAAGIPPALTQNYISNNYTTLRIECKNWFGSWAFSTTNSGARIVINARDVADGQGSHLLGTNAESYELTAGQITNLSVTCASAISGLYPNGAGKSYVYKSSKTILFPIAGSGTLPGLTNCSFYFKQPGMVFNSASSTRGNICFLGPGQTVTIEGADMIMSAAASQNIAIASKTPNSYTNDIYFINCRMNMGGNFYATTAGNLIRAHYANCINVITNVFSSTVTNILNDTSIDETWTNAGFRQ